MSDPKIPRFTERLLLSTARVSDRRDFFRMLTSRGLSVALGLGVLARATVLLARECEAEADPVESCYEPECDECPGEPVCCDSTDCSEACPAAFPDCAFAWECQGSPNAIALYCKEEGSFGDHCFCGYDLTACA